jgi:hypothetical protein
MIMDHLGHRRASGRRIRKVFFGLIAGVILVGTAMFCVREGRAAGSPLAGESHVLRSRSTPLIPTRIFNLAPTPVASPTPAPTALSAPEAVRLTSGGCCAYPAWSPDSHWVLFFDRPAEDAPAGLYSVPANGGAVTLVHPRVGVYNPDWTLLAYTQGEGTIVERLADASRWSIPSEGCTVRFSPGSSYVTWGVISSGISFPDLRQRGIWIARVDGSGAREIVTVNGGDLIGWDAGEEAIFVSGRLAPDGPAGVWRIAMEDGAGRLLMAVDRVRSALISPSGGWIAFIVAFDPDPTRNGLWLVQTDGSSVRKLDLFGAYRWRREGELLIIPLDMQAEGPSLWQVDSSTGETVRLTDPKHTKLSIANNDWQPSPDGASIVYLSFQDRNLWLLPLPEP